MLAIIGIDLGNYDTKTQETITPSSYKASKTQNHLAKECVYYDGTYYVPTKERNNQQLDKTENNYCLVMSLFAIAKEIIWQISDNYMKNNNGNAIPPAMLKEEIKKVDQIVLGIGLPAGHYSALAEKTMDCYMDNWRKGFSFTYKEYEFNLTLVKCSSFPQDFTAVAYNGDLKIPNEYSEYYIIGIGGGTVDVIPVHDGEPNVDKCRTLMKGTTLMYEHISSSLQQETADCPNYSSIEAILTGESSIIAEERKDRIKSLAEEYINTLVDDLVHIGLKLSDFPCVFIGGGALLMRPTLEKSPLIAMAEYVTDVNANAKYYADFANE